MIDFFIHTIFNDRHVTVVIENVKFYSTGYEGIIGVIDINKEGVLEELSEDEFIELNPDGEKVIDNILNKLESNHKKYPYDQDKYLLIM